MTSVGVAEVLQTHPCFSQSAHGRYGRIHLPVAPRCNLGCNYCERQIGGMSSHSYRPAVAGRILSPQEALAAVGEHMRDARLGAAGIAGPGEPLFNPATFETLKLLHETNPELTLCLSTNGLLLSEWAAALRALGVRTVTVTLNTVDPRVAEKIYARVRHEGEMLKGVEGAGLLVEKQLAGMGKAVEAGLIVKVNSILIPGINDSGQLEDVARAARELGAYIQNITPLIPLGAFSRLRAPGCRELSRTRRRCERIIRQFRLCRQCRADSVGVPGSEGIVK